MAVVSEDEVDELTVSSFGHMQPESEPSRSRIEAQRSQVEEALESSVPVGPLQRDMASDPAEVQTEDGDVDEVIEEATAALNTMRASSAATAGAARWARTGEPSMDSDGRRPIMEMAGWRPPRQQEPSTDSVGREMIVESVAGRPPPYTIREQVIAVGDNGAHRERVGDAGIFRERVGDAGIFRERVNHRRVDVEDLIRVPQFNVVEKVVNIQQATEKDIVVEVPEVHCHNIVTRIPKVEYQEVPQPVEVTEVHWEEDIKIIPEINTELVKTEVERLTTKEVIRLLSKRIEKVEEEVVEVPWRLPEAEHIIEKPVVDLKERLHYVKGKPQMTTSEEVIEVPHIVEVPKVEIVTKVETRQITREVKVSHTERVEEIVEVPREDIVETVVDVPEVHVEHQVRYVPKFESDAGVWREQIRGDQVWREEIRGGCEQVWKEKLGGDDDYYSTYTRVRREEGPGVDGTYPMDIWIKLREAKSYILELEDQTSKLQASLDQRALELSSLQEELRQEKQANEEAAEKVRTAPRTPTTVASSMEFRPSPSQSSASPTRLVSPTRLLSPTPGSSERGPRPVMRAPASPYQPSPPRRVHLDNVFRSEMTPRRGHPTRSISASGRPRLAPRAQYNVGRGLYCRIETIGSHNSLIKEPLVQYVQERVVEEPLVQERIVDEPYVQERIVDNAYVKERVVEIR